MQAARRGSLSAEQETDAAGPAPARSARGFVTVFLAVGALALVVDQVTKALATQRLTPGVPVHVVGDLLRFTLVFNPGAAFSTGTRFTAGLTVLAILATLVILWYGVRARTPLWTVGLGLLLAGVTGNLADRLFRDPGPMQGHVVDFLQLPSWPVFNVADMCINVGAVVLVVQAFRGVRLDGRRPSDAEAGSRAEAPESAE